MSRRILFGVVCAAAALGSGCGTVANTAYLAPYEGGERVYGGVQLAWEKAGSQENKSTLVTAAAYADVPLSAIGDTLALPYLLALSLTADRPMEPRIRAAQIPTESATPRPAGEPVDGWRPAQANSPITPTTYERLPGAIGP
jgi:uncharacterized protein YceK